MSTDYDVAVVGAGPAGSVAAREIAAAGFRVLLLEEHPQVGEPVHCSGLVTPRTLEAAGVGEEIVLNHIRGAIIHTPQGGQIILRDERVHALVIDLGLLGQQAQEAGATLVTGARVVALQHEEHSVRRHGVRLELRCRGRTSYLEVPLVIGADGSRSQVAQSLGVPPPQEAVVAVGGEIAASALAQDMVEVFARPDLAPGWFAWTIPLSPGVARIGIGSDDRRHSPRRLLNGLVDDYPHLRGRPFLRLQGGVIPLVPPRRVVGKRAMLVGDAAGQVKPTSGGGIYTSIQCARLCAQTAVQALQQGDVGGDALASYERLWMRHLGAELFRGRTLRRLLAQLSPKEVEGLLQLFTLEEVQAIGYRYGDIDFPARLFQRLFRPEPLIHGLRALPLRLWPRLALLLLRWYWAGGGADLPRTSR